MADQDSFAHSNTSPSSTASSTDLQTIQGPLTIAEFIHEIESATGSIVVTLSTGRRHMYVYARNVRQPLVDVNQLVNNGVALREANSLEEAQARTAANVAVGRRRISPKKRKEVIPQFISPHSVKTMKSDLYPGVHESVRQRSRRRTRLSPSRRRPSRCWS